MKVSDYYDDLMQRLLDLFRMINQTGSVERGSWEIPAGTLAPQENVEACARRELTEETGYDARDFEKIGEITPLPGYADERIHLFLASGLTPSAQDLDADELLSVHPTPLPRALAMVFNGEIQDAKTITGLLLAERRLQNGSKAPAGGYRRTRP